MPKLKHNPIDPDKVAQNPHLLPYAHTVGGAIIKPIDEGREKGVAMSAMYEQTATSLHQIKDQVELLLKQAQEIHDRIDISEKVYLAQCSFVPVMGQTYYLYEKSDGSSTLSMISPEEWGKKPPYHFLAKAKLLHDHTWDILELNKEKPIDINKD
ncbi:MAG: hypothetical protein ACJA01_003224 [Saprospiraceae bacterium]|jgi:hypothetical protein